MKYLIISTLIQVTLFGFLALIIHLLKNRRIKGFINFIGLKKSPHVPVKDWLKLVILFFVFIGVSIWFMSSFNLYPQGFIYDSFHREGLSLTTIAMILIWAYLQTSLSEEILFRGALRQLNFGTGDWRIGNIFQTVLFAITHNLGFLDKGLLVNLIIFVLVGAIAYIMGWIVEKKSQGSIFYTWIIHGTTNVLSALITMIFFL